MYKKTQNHEQISFRIRREFHIARSHLPQYIHTTLSKSLFNVNRQTFINLVANDALFFNNSILFLYNIWFSLLKSNNIAAETDSYVVGFPFLLLLKH